MPRRSNKQTKRAKDPNVLEESKTPKATALASLKTFVPQIFMDAQRPNEHLRSDSIRLRDIQLACCLNKPRLIGEKEDIDYDGEELFKAEVFRMINKVLPIRKKDLHADRIVRFVAGFLQYNQQRDAIAKEEFIKKKRRQAKEQAKQQAKQRQEEEEDDPMSESEQEAQEPSVEEQEQLSLEEEEEEEKIDFNNLREGEDEMDEIETVSSRFVEALLRHLLRGLSAKNTPVRTRCCQIISLSISSMGEIDEDLYQDLKTGLFDCIKDKEGNVRMQACAALCRLQTADDDVDKSDGQTIAQKLMWCLQFDPRADVRRIILFNIDSSAEVLPYIVERARDVDPMNRKVAYLKPLSDLADFRMLSFEERNQVLKWGLNDREESVQKAVSKMLSEKWIGHANNNLLEFLERLEIMKPDVTEIAESVLKSFFVARMEVINDISFDAEFWKNLSPESAFLSKVLISFLQKDDNYAERLDAILPEVSSHASNLKYYNDLYRTSTDTQDYEFITTQMLETALYLDYADEVGRRNMFELLRDILRSCELTDDHLSKIVKIFRLISLDERDFTRTIIEIISDIQEQINPFGDLEDPPVAKRSRLDEDSSNADIREEGSQILDSLVIRLRCLSICKRMLENSQESLTNNSNLYGLLNDLIVPAVQNSDNILREEGLHCLGLCCTLDKELAQHNINLFIHCIKNGQEEILKKCIMILFDLMMTYGVQSISERITNPNEIREVFEFCLDHDSLEIQAITTEGLAKLMLAKRFQDEEVLRLMILLYFFPTTGQANTKVQQILAYFFPAYCYSSADHQKVLSKVTIPALEELCNTFADLQEDETMVNPIQIADMLADWTDPRKIAKAFIKDVRYDDDKVSDIPGSLAIETIKIIQEADSGAKRKTMCHFLLRLYLDEQESQVLEETVKMLKVLLDLKEKPLKEVLIRNQINKLVNTLETAIRNND